MSIRINTNELQKFNNRVMAKAIEQYKTKVDTSYISDILTDCDWSDFEVEM